VKSQTTARYRALFNAAPAGIQEKIRAAYQLWSQNPAHPSLRFKKVHATQPIYSVRVDLDWRALGLVEGDTVVWFWVGPHGEYERLLKAL